MTPKPPKDPTSVPVQLNVTVPFFIREVLLETAYERRVSMAHVVRAALEKELSKELAERARRLTTEAGSTT